MSAATIRIRPALPTDQGAIIELIQVLNVFEAGVIEDRLVTRAAAEAYYPTLIDRIARQEGRLLVAEAEGTVIGMLGLIVEDNHVFVREDVRRHGYVTDLVVAEAWRGRGVGRALLTEAERLTRAKGLKRLMITVVAGNHGAERLYEDFGFAPYARALAKPL